MRAAAPVKKGGNFARSARNSARGHGGVRHHALAFVRAPGKIGVVQRLPCVMKAVPMQQCENDFRRWIRLIRSEYAEMPGLHLSKRQAQRLWNLDARSADALFDALETSHYLKRMPNDMYVRGDVGC